MTIGEDELVAAAPYRVVVKPNQPDPKSCTIEGDGLRRGFVGQECEFVIMARDAYGNRCAGAGTGNEAMEVQVRATDIEEVFRTTTSVTKEAAIKKYKRKIRKAENPLMQPSRTAVELTEDEVKKSVLSCDDFIHT